MATQKSRFLFDDIFDEEYQQKLRRAAEAARLAEEEAAANAPPTYSQDEIDEAKEASYQLGRQEGMSAAMAGIEQQVAVALEGVLSQIGKLTETHRKWTSEMQRDAVRLSATIMRKLAPELTRGTELPQIEHVINQAFQFLTEQPKVMIRVAAEIEEPLRDKVQLMASRVGYEGEVVLVGDPELVATDCRVSWAAGAVERALDETWSEIDEMVERTVSALPPRSGIGSDVPASPEVDDAGEMPDETEHATAMGAETEAATEPEPDDEPGANDEMEMAAPLADTEITTEVEQPDMDLPADPDEAEVRES
ncbi:FliH/SctL family protein [Nisaea acidiphila]|uniref:FliH/SctL family protein n=1 Tax=Nisaea acidiphila TaxID=1862145 RepID=A0A9J7AT61_9PROT|nr:FliH/SctL family protein [Nisaea acidiphila]UUX50512.1 FliH/SctL family protein [Nisaea acidiphila]